MSTYVKRCNSLQIHLQMQNFLLILGLTPNRPKPTNHQVTPTTTPTWQNFPRGRLCRFRLRSVTSLVLLFNWNQCCCPEDRRGRRGFHLAKLRNSTLQGAKAYQDLAMTRNIHRFHWPNHVETAVRTLQPSMDKLDFTIILQGVRAEGI